MYGGDFSSDAHYSSDDYELLSNKVTSISSSSTNTQYPTAKLLYDKLSTKQNQATSSTTDITAGTTTLATGDMYLVYE